MTMKPKRKVRLSRELLEELGEPLRRELGNYPAEVLAAHIVDELIECAEGGGMELWTAYRDALLGDLAMRGQHGEHVKNA